MYKVYDWPHHEAGLAVSRGRGCVCVCVCLKYQYFNIKTVLGEHFENLNNSSCLKTKLVKLQCYTPFAFFLG